MTAPDPYWSAVAQASQKSAAQTAKLTGEFRQSARASNVRMEDAWKKRYDSRKRGRRLLCLSCGDPKAKDDFLVKKGRAQAECKTCRGKRKHRKKEAR